jgi:hypothetical protein
MIAFEVLHNEQRLCTAGVGPYGVLSAIITWVVHDPQKAADWPDTAEKDPEEGRITVSVGGLADDVHQNWPGADLKAGDSVLIRICDAAEVDPPSESKREPAEHRLVSNQNYVREMCRQWGWSLTEQ